MSAEPIIETRFDHRRGCGWRQPGGLYLVGRPEAEPCPLLPIPIHPCPQCGVGIRKIRGWQWVTSLQLGMPGRCPQGCPGRDCPASCTRHTLGLLWVGLTYYATAKFFLAEAQMHGFSKRISAVPRHFKAGRDWVALAHAKGVAAWGRDGHPGVIALWRPSAVEYVVRDDDPPDRLAEMADQGITLVQISRVEPPPSAPPADGRPLFVPPAVEVSP